MTHHTRVATALSAILKPIRMEQGLSKHTVATRMGLATDHQIANWEAGIHDPRLSSLERWAAALGYELDLHPKD